MLYDPHLDLFLKVADFGCFSKAADAGFITPSAVIKQSNEVVTRARAAMLEQGSVIRLGTSPMTPAEVLVELWPKLSEVLPGVKFRNHIVYTKRYKLFSKERLLREVSFSYT